MPDQPTMQPAAFYTQPSGAPAAMFTRKSTVEQTIAGTQIRATLNLDGSGQATIQTSVPLLDHLLSSFARQSRFDLELSARSNTESGNHQAVEGIGGAVGQALARSLGEKRGIARFGSALTPLDEALARAVVDIADRPFLVYEAPGLASQVGRFDTTLAEEFWRAFSNNAAITLHLDLLRGKDPQHMLEALFNSAGLALHAATRIIDRGGAVPFTRGTM